VNFLSHLTPNTQFVLLGVYVVLVLAGILLKVTQYFKPGANLTSVQQRINAWWAIVIVFSLALLGSKGTTIFFIALVSYLAMKEYFSLIEIRRVDRRVLFWLYLSIPIQYYFAYSGNYEAFLTFIPIFLFLFVAFRMAIAPEIQGFLKSAGTAHWGVMITVFSLSHLAYFVNFPVEKNPAGGWPGLLCFVIFLTEANDVSQFLCGKIFGRYKITPEVSPNKTVEGFIGGVITTTLLSMLLAPILTPLTSPYSIYVGLLIAFGGFVGDIVMSAVKRDLGIKDFGSTLPGHGGVLDRIDSLTFTAPLFFHFIRYFVWNS
jgi:phosphatidate cytidylyltransferase